MQMLGQLDPDAALCYANDRIWRLYELTNNLGTYLVRTQLRSSTIASDTGPGCRYPVHRLKVLPTASSMLA